MDRDLVTDCPEVWSDPFDSFSILGFQHSENLVPIEQHVGEPIENSDHFFR